jgi:hypothetical protein
MSATRYFNICFNEHNDKLQYLLTALLFMGSALFYYASPSLLFAMICSFFFRR